MRFEKRVLSFEEKATEVAAHLGVSLNLQAETRLNQLTCDYQLYGYNNLRRSGGGKWTV